jgi:hypothetical protein
MALSGLFYKKFRVLLGNLKDFPLTMNWLSNKGEKNGQA